MDTALDILQKIPLFIKAAINEKSNISKGSSLTNVNLSCSNEE